MLNAIQHFGMRPSAVWDIPHDRRRQLAVYGKACLPGERRWRIMCRIRKERGTRCPPFTLAVSQGNTEGSAWTMECCMNRRSRLPIGIQSFRRLRETNSYYVDKTPLIRELIDQSDYCFLSRPRRFGKSLLLDTLKSLFEGHEELFRGLDIHGHWDWSVCHPVVRLSFGGKYNHPDDLERSILTQLEVIERNAGLSATSLPYRARAPVRSSRSPAPLHRATRGRPGGRVRQADPRRAP